MSFKSTFLQNKTTGQTIVKNTFWLSAGEIGSRLLRAVFVIYAARVLGSAGYGVFSYVLSLAGFFTIFADIGISQILTREISQKPNKEDEYFTTGLWTKVGLLAVNALIIIFLVPLFAKIEAAKPLIPLAAILITFDNLRNFISAYFRGKEKMEYEALLTISTNVAITAVGFIILTLSATPTSLTLAYILSAGVGAVLGGILVRKKIDGLFSKFKKDLVRPMLSSAWPLAVMGAFGAFMLNIDILIIGFFRSSSEVGLYSAGQKVVQMLYILPTIISAAMFPVFSKFVKSEKWAGLKRLATKSTTVLFMFALPLAVGGVILGESLISFLYGAEYLPATLPFQLLAITVLLVFPGMIMSNYALAFDKHKKLVPIVLVASAVNIGLDIALIPPFGIVGCAIATIIVGLIYNGLAWRLAKRINNFTTLKHLKKIALGTVVMAVGAVFMKGAGIHVIISIFVSIIVYFGILYILREKTLIDLKAIVTG